MLPYWALRERRYIGVCGRRSYHETCSLSVPQVTALFLRLRELGVDVDPTTFTVEQAVPQLRALLEGRAHA